MIMSITGKEEIQDTKSLKTSVIITMQNEVLLDLLSTLNEVKTSKGLTRTNLMMYQNAIDSELETANKYNKNILGGVKVSEEEIEEYIKVRTFKRIKDTYWSIMGELTERMEKFKSKDTSNSVKPSECSTSCDLRLPTITLGNSR